MGIYLVYRSASDTVDTVSPYMSPSPYDICIYTDMAVSKCAPFVQSAYVASNIPIQLRCMVQSSPRAILLVFIFRSDHQKY